MMVLKDVTQVQETYASNPFCVAGSWFWYDETGDISTAYETEAEAEKVLAGYIDYLENGPPIE